MLDSLVLDDQNVVCGSNKDQRDHFPRIHPSVSLFSGMHQIRIPTFPFDPPTQSDTSKISLYKSGYVFTLLELPFHFESISIIFNFVHLSNNKLWSYN